jgi:hypothetical protein
MPTIVVQGNNNNWTNTGIQVAPGQWVRITASGWISFALGAWHRSPDGVDQNGQGREFANNAHPGPELVKNSLIASLGGRVIQAGSNMAFFAPAGGTLHFIPNDEFLGDNNGFWQVNVEVGKLRQRLLVVTQGAIDPQRAKLIAEGIALFRTLVLQYTDDSVVPDIVTVDVDGPVHPSEMVPPVPPPGQGSELRVATYSALLHNLLLQRDVTPESMDGIFRFYVQPPDAGQYAYWTWAGIPGVQRRIGYSAIAVNRLGPNAESVAIVMLREYLQQLDIRFHEIGVANFRSPRNKPQGVQQSDLQFFEQVMRRLENSGAAPNYGLLHGVFGRLG